LALNEHALVCVWVPESHVPQVVGGLAPPGQYLPAAFEEVHATPAMLKPPAGQYLPAARPVQAEHAPLFR